MTSTLSTLLDKASGIELQVAEIYEHFAKRFDDNATLCHFWTLFAEAERYHSLLIQMQKLAMTNQTDDQDQVSSWDEEIVETEGYLNSILDKFTKAGWSPTITEAFELAHEIECKSLEIQSRSFTLFESPAIKDLVAKLHEEDMKHRAKLLMARQHFAPDE